MFWKYFFFCAGIDCTLLGLDALIAIPRTLGLQGRASNQDMNTNMQRRNKNYCPTKWVLLHSISGQQSQSLPVGLWQEPGPVHGCHQVWASRQLVAALLPCTKGAWTGTHHVRSSGFTLEHGGSARSKESGFRTGLKILVSCLSFCDILLFYRGEWMCSWKSSLSR